MNRLVAILLSLTICASSFSAGNTDSLINVLNSTIEQRGEFVKIKNDHIKQLTTLLANKHISETKAFNITHEVYTQYKSFIYDSAFHYAQRLQLLAYRLNDPVKIAQSKLNMGFVLFSSGLFREALDTFRTIHIKGMPDSLKIEYYGNLGRTYYDIATYSQDHFYSPKYDELGSRCIDSAIYLSKPKSFSYLTLSGLKLMKENDFNSARKNFEQLLHDYKLTYSQYAIATSSLAYIYLANREREKALEMLVYAACADIRSSTKETVAMRNLAEILYQDGRVTESFHYIKIAMEEANIYNARHRKNQIATILPIIEEHEMSTLEKQKKQLFNYAMAVSALSVVVVFFLLLFLKQLYNVRRAKKEVSDTNDMLEQTNGKLNEANKIKEEYIGYYFNITSEYIGKLEAFKKALSRLINLRRFDEVEMLVNNINPKKEREELYVSFDKIFLKLFPAFITKFNTFFKEEDRVESKENEILTSDVRIFALIRMGITDNEKIARILNFSVHTVYAYKTKIKTKSILPNEQFEDKIMEIKSV